jgi:hypothetical protein
VAKRRASGGRFASTISPPPARQGGFGYRRLFVLLRREGEPSGINRIYRLYREEGLTIRQAIETFCALEYDRRSCITQIERSAARTIEKDS